MIAVERKGDCYANMPLNLANPNDSDDNLINRVKEVRSVVYNISYFS